MTEPLALDVSLERARALHRVWRALNDGDCPRCHKMHAATDVRRVPDGAYRCGYIECPSCHFRIYLYEIEAIEEMFAPAMNAATAIFEEWRKERQSAS